LIWYHPFHLKITLIIAIKNNKYVVGLKSAKKFSPNRNDANKRVNIDINTECVKTVNITLFCVELSIFLIQIPPFGIIVDSH
ncbi:MAG: hypothetical protein K2G60_01995, partial [Oscillospiraceae bacterium]|nr:hypothetical protein [Oscillospiraceae bacterium]